jgi:nucleoside-diphosphate-sugar epimerase
MALLHSCCVRLPTDKAERVLGFSPPIPFAEGCRRSIEWLRVEGYVA